MVVNSNKLPSHIDKPSIYLAFMTSNSCGTYVFLIAYDITIVLGISQAALDIVTYLTPGRGPELSIVLILKVDVIYR